MQGEQSRLPANDLQSLVDVLPLDGGEGVELGLDGGGELPSLGVLGQVCYQLDCVQDSRALVPQQLYYLLKGAVRQDLDLPLV